MDRFSRCRRRRILGAVGAAFGSSLAGCAAPRAGGRDTATEAPAFEFEEVATKLGLDYEFARTRREGGNKEFISNAGVYVNDFNRDGYPDILAIGGEQPVLFENETGDAFRRSEALPTYESDIPITSALFFDHDNNGWEDLLLLVDHEPPIFLENQRGTFVETSVGFDVIDWSESGEPIGAAAADYNNDGYLDVFIIQNGDWGADRPAFMTADVIENPAADNGAENYLFRGDGESFSLVQDAGIHGSRWSLATSFLDLTGDGYPDIHVGNDFNYDVIYLNQGDGTFTHLDVPDSDRHAMSSTIGNITETDTPDIFVTNIFYPELLVEAMAGGPRSIEGNNLFTLRNGTFVDVADELGVRKGGWGWAGVIADFRNEGTESIIHATTPTATRHFLIDALDITEERLMSEFPYLQCPAFFERTPDGSFELRGAHELGFECTDGRGLAELDIDRNGSIDLAMAAAKEPDSLTRWEGRYRLYRNRTPAQHWLQVELRGPPDHTVIGSEVTVETGTTTQSKLVHSRTDFLSQSWRTLHFGLGDVERADVTIVWAHGDTHEFSGIEVDQRLHVHADGTLESL